MLFRWTQLLKIGLTMPEIEVAVEPDGKSFLNKGNPNKLLYLYYPTTTTRYNLLSFPCSRNLVLSMHTWASGGEQGEKILSLDLAIWSNI